MADSGQKSNTTSTKRKKKLAVSEGSQGKQRKIHQLWQSKKTGRASNSKAFGRPIEINELYDDSVEEPEPEPEQESEQESEQELEPDPEPET